jgi:uncharacterized protein YjbI with pentapeptide repeats
LAAPEGVGEAARRLLLARAAGAPADADDAGVFDGVDVSADRVCLAKCDLRGASFRGADLSGADLSGADLNGAAFSNIRLRGARLEEAVLRGADLIGADLSGSEAGEAEFSEALLEDARLVGARLRFARFDGAVMDGADFSDADLWGAVLENATAERAVFRAARLDEANLQRADLTGADFSAAILRRADLRGAVLRGAVLREATFDGADLSGADLTGAVLPYVVLTGCTLRHIRVAGAWLERTRLRADQLGGAIGEEVAGEFAAAREAYIELEQNFRALGSGEDARWAFLRRRRMGKRAQAGAARAAWRGGARIAAGRHAVGWAADVFTEQLCDYGESVPRVLRAFCVVLLAFAALYWATGALTPRPTASAWAAGGRATSALNYVLYSLDSMTTVGSGDVALQPGSELGVLLSSMETVLGTVLIGLFGFVLGARMRN